MHRVVIYCDGGDKGGQMVPFTTCPPVGSANPRDLLDGEDWSAWHSQFMAGVFYAAFDRLVLFEIGVGWSEERTVFTFDVDWLIR